MTSEVFFTPARASKREEALPRRVARLCAAAKLGDVVTKGDLAAVKMHFGEPGNAHFLRPILVAPIVDAITEAGGKPFLTDSNTLYTGGRANAVDHTWAAIRHGFAPPAVNAPIVIADGLKSRDGVEVEVGLKHCRSVRIGSAVVHADALIVVSHFKGHLGAGYGGSLKNLGMGAATRSGKQVQHSDAKPKVDQKACIGCGVCTRHCPGEALTLNAHKKAVVDQEKCLGCAECVAYCPNKAISIRWDATSDNLQEKIVEHAAGALKGKEGKSIFINFLLNVTPDCDCLGWSDLPLVPDIGVLASHDPVAVDQACIDMVLDAVGNKGSAAEGALCKGEDKLRQAHPKIDYTRQVAYAEQIGLGSRKYKLVTV